MGTKGKSKDPESISFAHAASGSSLENNFWPQIARIAEPQPKKILMSAARGPQLARFCRCGTGPKSNAQILQKFSLIEWQLSPIS